MSLLAIIWFCLAPLLLIIYCVSDGFDLGVGSIYGYFKNPKDKSDAIYAIWPVWNGNEVWLIASFGVLLAAFPPAFGTLLSAMYVPVYLVLFSVILRGVSIEFFPKTTNPLLKKVLEAAFIFGSAFIIFAIGFVGGNVLSGLPIDSQGVMQKNFLYLFNPFSIAAGIASALFFAGHGVAYLILKTEGELKERLKHMYSVAWGLSMALLIIAFISGLFLLPGSMTKPLTIALIVLSFVLYGLTFWLNRRSSYGLSFTFSSLTIAGIISACATSAFPVIVPSSLSKDFSLTIANCASTDKSLLSSLIIVLIGLPFIIGFVTWIYRVFRKSPAEHY